MHVPFIFTYMTAIRSEDKDKERVPQSRKHVSLFAGIQPTEVRSNILDAASSYRRQLARVPFLMHAAMVVCLSN